jgi:predicted permease
VSAPPRLARALARRLLPDDDGGRCVLGDLDEEFRDREARASRRAARRWYRREAAGIAGRYAWRRLAAMTPGPAWRRLTAALAGGLMADLRHTARGLRRSPGTTAAAAITLAIGIGAATAVFSVADTVVLEPLPYAHADRLVHIRESATTGARMSVAWPDFLDWRDRVRTIAELSCYQRTAFTLTGAGEPERLVGRVVCGNLLEVLGVQPALGRAFDARDDRPGAALVAIVSDALWRSRLGADPRVVGRALRLDGRTYTIVGVLGPRFWFMGRTDVLVPLGPTITGVFRDRVNHMGLYAIGRLAPAASLGAARAEMSAIAATIARENPKTSAGVGADVAPLLDAVVGDVRPAFLALLGAVGCLLLLACANVANLLVARGAARRHEMTIRALVGGGRWRLARQALVESLLLAAAGTAGGVVLAWWLVGALVASAPADVPRLANVGLDLPALAFAAGACLLSGLVFGVIPAWHAGAEAAAPALVRAPRSGGAARLGTRRVLLSAEVALAVLLLAGAGLMIQTVVRLLHVDPGFRVEGLVTGRVQLPGSRYPAERRQAFADELLPRLRALPGVTAAAIAESLPIDGSDWQAIFMARDRPLPPRAEMPSANIDPVSPGFVAALGMRLVEGRAFAAHEPRPVVIINEKLARQIWPGERAIGRQLRIGFPETPESLSPWSTVIGVVGDVKFDGLAAGTPLQIYYPTAMFPPDAFSVVVRTAGDPDGLAPALRRAVAALDPELPVSSLQTMEAIRRASTAREGLLARLFVLFAAAALLLAAVGLAGIVAQGVTERTHEIGVRVALGARRGHVMRLVTGRVLAATAAGAAIGVVGALVLSRWIAGLLFGVTPTDPLTLTSVVVLLGVVAFVAAWLPARRATAVDPLAALRIE